MLRRATGDDKTPKPAPPEPAPAIAWARGGCDTVFMSIHGALASGGPVQGRRGRRFAFAWGLALALGWAGLVPALAGPGGQEQRYAAWRATYYGANLIDYCGLFSDEVGDVSAAFFIPLSGILFHSPTDLYIPPDCRPSRPPAVGFLDGRRGGLGAAIEDVFGGFGEFGIDHREGDFRHAEWRAAGRAVRDAVGHAFGAK